MWYCVVMGYQTIPGFNDSGTGQKSFENIVGKEENPSNQYFILFPQSFQSCKGKFVPF